MMITMKDIKMIISYLFTVVVIVLTVDYVFRAFESQRSIHKRYNEGSDD